MGGGASQKALLSGGHIVEANHAVSRSKQSIDHVATDESSRTRNENPQSNLHVKREKPMLLERESASFDSKMTGAMRSVFLSIRSGCSATHNATSNSWRTIRRSRASRVADKATAHAVFADLGPPSSLPAKLPPSDSLPPRQAGILPPPNVPVILQRQIQAVRKASRKPVHSRSGLWVGNSV